MKDVIVNKIRIKIYDSIDELPIKRFHKYNKFMLIDGGVGSDINDINSHISKILKYIVKDDKKNARVELENMRQLLYLVTEELSPKHLSFAALVYEINGVKVTDISDDGLKNVLKKLGTVKKKWFDNMIESLKKKIDEDLTLYFKNEFETSNIKEYYDKLKKRTLLQLNELINEVDEITEIEKIDDALILFFNPKDFGSGSVEVEYDTNFETMCLVISQRLNLNPKDMNVMEFYSSFEYVKKMIKEESKNNRRIKK